MQEQPAQKECWSLCAEATMRSMTDFTGLFTRAQKYAVAAPPWAAHRLAYTEWGNSNSTNVLLCVPGVFRNSRDFDPLGRDLSEQGWRVVCLDLPGRGRSEWFADPAHYNPTQYLFDCASIIARLNATEICWLGTSLGGALGLTLAVHKGSPIKRLILNDVGIVTLPDAARALIASYAAADPTFGTLGELEAYLRKTYAAFGNLTDDQWKHMARHSQRDKAGRLGLAYDPRIGQQVICDMLELENPLFANAMNETLKKTWDQLPCPVLVLRGENSIVLPAETAARMAEKPGVTLNEFADCGHAPALMDAEQIAVVSNWLVS